MIRRFLSRIAVRLLLFNVLLVFLPVAGLLSLRVLERQLLDLQERSMVQQGRLVASAVSASPEGLNAEAAAGLIRRLGGHSEARIRVVDRTGNVVADSASMPVRRAPPKEPPSRGVLSRRSFLYRVGAALWQPFKAFGEMVRRATDEGPSEPGSDAMPSSVLTNALAGEYGATVRESAGQRSLTMYSALPVRVGGDGAVIGAVVVSQSTSRILLALWRVRLSIFRVVVFSVFVAAILSLLVSATIARPLIRLRNEADDLLDPRGRLRKTFGGSLRRDEIGDLTRALETLTARLERHLAFVESFSADVSHEFKNPLASIRSAAELLAATEDPATQKQLAATIEREVARLNRLLNGVREVSKIDAALDTEPVQPVDLGRLLDEIVAATPARSSRIQFDLAGHRVVVSASPDRLKQAFVNVIDNALSFTPANGRVDVRLHAEVRGAVVTVEDDGPGIPPEHGDRIFERFFSFRPAEPDERQQHDGLGLAIARAIVEGYGGTISAANAPPRGLRVEVILPVVKGVVSEQRSGR